MGGQLTIVGVRHHSPACARVVAHAIATLRPRFVLIEGPSDMNTRLDELLLDHRLPIALYSYRLPSGGGGSQASWAPFCDYSPEWVALRQGKAAGSEPLFIDLPAWDDAFAQVENRYSDAHLQVSGRLASIASELGFDGTDTLWDHLFEQPGDPAARLEALSTYFEALRADEPPSAGDDRREAFMAQWIAWAMDQAGDEDSVLVVCGGYHKRALEQLWERAPKSRPEIETPEERVGSYLVPFSFRRMDSFAGYASGMPSPGFYQAEWEDPPNAAEHMLWAAIERLRARHQVVSTADAIAASHLMRGLAALRGHPTPLRADVLDALAGALLKASMSRPPPWSSRGPLPPGSEPLLVELVAVFSGEGQGALAPTTPRPPLLADVETELRRVGLRWTDEEVLLRLDVLDSGTEDRRRVLHRLNLLRIPGVELLQRADLHRAVSRTEEAWRLRRALESEPALIERAVYGATLAHAALAKVMESVHGAERVRPLADALETSVLAGFHELALELASQAGEAIEREPSFAELGTALARFLAAQRAIPEAKQGMDALGSAALERGLWLLEGLDGPHLPFDEADVAAVGAVRNWMRELDARSEVFARRAASDQAPPALRGACLGALWSLPGGADEAAASRTLRAIPDATLGDFLAGLFALAREQFSASSSISAVHDRLQALGEEDFLIALPALRRAFSFFPPRERMEIAQRVVNLGELGVAPHQLLEKTFSPESVRRASELEAAAFRTVERFGLFGGTDG